MFSPVIFREYDIRGVYNEQFDLNFAYNLGRAFASYVAKKTPGKKDLRVSIGYDARESSTVIVKKLAQGMKESGLDVSILGLVTTPVCYFSTFQLDLDGAIMITGSHNPPEYNGFKVSLGKTTIHGDEIQALRRIMEKEDYISGAGKIQDYDIAPEYLTRYKTEFGDLKNLKVVLDSGNGAGGSIIRRLYNAVGLYPEILFEEPDGNFPNHHPDPTVEHNLEDLKKKVLEMGAVCGIGFDGDADRIGVVDHTGKMIYGDELMTIFARDVLKTNKGAKIVGDVKCSDRMYNDIAKNGGIPILWKTGHSLVKEKIKTENAPFGGEMSGHIFFADRNYGYDDAPYAGLRLCEILVKTGKTIPQLLEGLPSAFNTPEIRIDTTEDKKVLIVEKVKEKFSKSTDKDIKVNLIDGIRVSFADGWALARSSNTQPVLVVRFESTTAEGLARIQDSIMSVVNQYL